MWTKLLYLQSIGEAIKPHILKGKWHRPLIGSRYKNLLKKQFRLANIPWIYEEKSEKLNPRDKKPKGHKSEKLKIIHLEKVKKSLISNEENELKYRQERLNNRKYGGLDRLVQLTFPSFISMKREKTYDEKREEADTAILGDKKRGNYIKKKKEAEMQAQKAQETAKVETKK